MSRPSTDDAGRAPAALRLPHVFQDLRTVTMGVLFLAFAALAALQWFSARSLYEDSFSRAEIRDALAQARHAQSLAQYPLNTLQRTTIDNGLWDEAYEFMEGRNPRHPSNLTAMNESFRLLRVSGYAFLRLDGSLFFARQFDAPGMNMIDVDPEILAALQPGGMIGRMLRAKGETVAYSHVGRRILAWCSAPIMHSDGRGPQNGWWVMFSALDAHFLTTASQAVGAQVSLQVRPALPADAHPVHTPLASDEVRVLPLDESVLEVRFPLGALDDEGTLDMVMDGARDAHVAALRASRYLLWTTLLFGTVVTALALRFVVRRLLQPVAAASRVLDRIGDSGDLSLRLPPAPADDEIARLVRTTNDMLADLERKRDVEAAMLDALPDVLLRVGVDGIVRDVRVPDASLRRGFPAAGERFTRGLPALAAESLARALALSHESGTRQHVEYSVTHAEGGRSEFEARITMIDPGEALVLLRDITQRRQVEEQVRHLAYFDVLTELPNRSAFMDRLAREVRRAKGAGGRFALLFLDLDAFKQINDTQGHGAGDRVLLQTAARLREALRPGDSVSRLAAQTADALHLARLGGDEFTILIADVGGPEDALAVASRIGAVMRRPFEIDGREFTMTTSIGIALYPEDGTDAETLLQHADTAMYHAKREGRDNSQLYSAALTEQAMYRLDLESSLRTALANDEFHLVYQPVVDLRTGRLSAVEALLRWTHPVRGLIGPATFIPLAEECGQIGAIGRWVLQTACADLARWRGAGLDCRVAINVSPRQFAEADLVESVFGALAHNGLAPDRLEIEITEGAVMETFAPAVAALNVFRARGVRIALDDFGTGYSSLSYLVQMPIDVIKVDRSFVGRLPAEETSASIVKAILALAGAMGISVTAEGVESRQQAALLGAMDCRYGQGYYFSAPVPAAEIAAMAARHWRIDEAGAAASVAAS